jgi:cytoskeletal protein RodZ
MLPSWAITFLIVISGAGFLIIIAVIFAIKSRRSQPPSTSHQLSGPAHQSTPAHQGAPIHLQSAPVHQTVPAHHQSAPAHQDASEDSASVDSELAAEIHEALSASQGASEDIELSIQTQTQGDISPVGQSASNDDDNSEASIETPTPTQAQRPIIPANQA